MAPPKLGVPFRSPRTLQSLVDDLGGSTTSHNHVVLHTVATPDRATTRSLIPVLHPRALQAIGQAAALLITPELAPRATNRLCWVHSHARWALAMVLRNHVASPDPPNPSISPHAIIENDTAIASCVRIGHGAVILAGASIGEGSTIEPNAVIYGGVRLGCRVHVGAGAIVGRPGFGWAHGPNNQLVRMPQLGGVEVEDDVEIGPLATVDAGTLKPTRLRRGCKLDAQVHVGHNVEIGESTIVAAQSGFAGSVTVGDHVLIGGQVGVADNVTIGDHARLAGRAGVIGTIAPHATVAGYPAVDRLRWLRAVARMMRG